MAILETLSFLPNLTLEPSSRLFWPFLLSSLFVIWLGTKGEFLKQLRHPSSIIDAKIFLINGILKATIFPLFLISSFSVSVVLTKLLYKGIPSFSGLGLSDFALKGLLTILAFVVNDFFRFIHHFLMHKLPGLKLLHRTHHSALVLTPLTLFRAHPLEAFIASFRNILSLGVTLGLFSFLAQKPINGWDILGVNAFGFLFNAILANLRHSPIPISFGIFEYLFISPRMHQVHHSNNPKHYDKNYGVALSLWDQICGSFYRPAKNELESLAFGLHQEMNESAWNEATTLKGILLPKTKKAKAKEMNYRPLWNR